MAGEITNMKCEVPFIARFAESRRSSPPFPGRYNEALKISVIMKSGREVPLITAYDNPEIYTKTDAIRESDDDDKLPILLDSIIKTFTQRETDSDESHPAELMTKTAAGRESDDDEKRFALELYTKTKVEREGDDHHFDVQ